MMDENRLDNIVECSYNMDNGYVEVWYVDGNMLRIKCEEIEAALRTTEQSLAKLHKLLDNKPIEYVAMALSGEMQAYCDNGIVSLDDDFQYPSVALEFVKNLYMECANYKIQEKNCQSDCQKYLSRWPVLRVKHIRYQVIMFERVD